ncbi:SPFH/Band 7/PHB domain protein [Cutibacterium equinum]|uniref:SPFH/Band 7/PHB domain protein n=1 Tax=Cutibacterium equinum TaxID=3016342 RepID=A0ABY7QX77_9ACTN|nr:SPFH domain-containing protein [Cutibacterium equinum]WCC79280.1 SPFH/Band 7/PHB domain protein [Cutibacterium equinum]
MPQLIVTLVIVALVVVVLASSVKIIHQQKIGLVERLGKFHRRLNPGPHLLMPIIDRVQYDLDMREQVVPFPPQGVITEDNLMVNIDSVIYFQIVDPERAAYEAQSYKIAIEQLTMTTLRNIIGGMDMEAALTSREEINQKLRAVLDEATGKWGIKVNRVELRAIEPPPTIRDAMEKGARAERDKRAAILLAEGERQSQILSAGGDRESAILRAQGDREAAVLRAQADRQAQMLRAEGEAQAITTVFNAIHAGQPDQGLLAYQYMQMLPTLARGDSNKVWVVPSELNDALKGLGSLAGTDGHEPSHGGFAAADPSQFSAPEKVDVFAEIEAQKVEEKKASEETVQQAIQEAAKLENPGLSGMRHQQPDQMSGARSLSRDQIEGQPEGESADTAKRQEPWSTPQSDSAADQPTGDQRHGDEPFSRRWPSQDQ